MNIVEKYVSEFNENDEELVVNSISNKDALKWMNEEIPYLYCPDKEIEKTYYFRWWTYRKHIKETEDGYMITEFLPKVSWSGKHNTINATCGHHINEGRWLKNAGKYLNDYIKHFLTYEGGLRYSSWLIYASLNLYKTKHCFDLQKFYDLAVCYFEKVKELHKTDSGLYFSVDGLDAMEYSISGRHNFQKIKGLRPTLNSYIYAGAKSLYEISVLLGKPNEKYLKEAETIKELMYKYLYQDEFFKAFHPLNEDFTMANKEMLKDVPKELLGFIPWIYSLPNKGDEKVFEMLWDKEIFYAPQGLTTADMRDERFLYEVDHECLWNGYVWPFATSQTLTALLNVIRHYDKNEYSEKYFELLHQYATQHHRITQDGKKIMWIDEVRHPFNDDWSSRTILESLKWSPDKGGKERGKDYNHSTFADLVLSALTGFEIIDNKAEFNPIIPNDWDWYKIENLYIDDKKYTIVYDKTGEKFGNGKGFKVIAE